MTDIFSLILYILVFSVSALLFWYGNKQKNKIIIWGALLLPVILASLRYMVGTDYGTYISLFSKLRLLSFSEYFSDMSVTEPGLFLLSKLSDLVTGDHMAMFAISSVLSVGFFYLGLRRYGVKHPTLVYFLYLCVLFPMTLNLVRQGIAISICFYAFSFILVKDFRSYFFWVLIASLFHISALLMIPVYFIARLFLSRLNTNNAYAKLILKVIVLMSVIYLLLPTLMSLAMDLFDKYSSYQIDPGEGANNTFFLQLIVLIVGIVFARWAMMKSDAKLYSMLIVLASIEVALMTVGFSSAFIKRIGLYFSIFSLMLLVESFDIFKDRLGRFVSISLVVLYGLIYFYLAYYILGQADVIPYKLSDGGGIL